METTQLNTEKLNQAAEMLKAIAHPMRIAIINLLQENNKLSVTDIYTALGIEQAVASHQLGVLKKKGVLAYEKEGTTCYYFLKYKRLTQIISCVEKCID